jgi:rfaE bifunctional protein nucleotidyltransferase chain/domain
MASEKIVEINELTEICDRLREQDRQIVLCHGCFDFLHFGHLRHFNAARKEGDVLVVTVTPDAYVHKGPGRPFYHIEERIEFLAALDLIDYVCVNPWPTAAETIGTIKPHKFVKGGEYRDGTAQQDARFRQEVAALEKIGAQMVFTDEVTFSSSRILGELASDITE